MNALQRIVAWLGTGRTAVIGVPYLWLLIFFLAPFLIVFGISVSEMEGVRFTQLLQYQEGILQLKIKLSNYVFITQDGGGEDRGRVGAPAGQGAAAGTRAARGPGRSGGPAGAAGGPQGAGSAHRGGVRRPEGPHPGVMTPVGLGMER